MSEDPHPPRNERNKLPEETKTGRAFPLLAPLLVVAVALIIMLVFWLPN